MNLAISYKLFILFFIFIFISISTYSYSDFIEDKGFIQGTINLNNSMIKFNYSTSKIELKCKYEENYYYNIDNCISNCSKESKKCIMKDDLCYYCVEKEKPKPFYIKILERIRNWVKNVINKEKVNDLEKIEKETIGELLSDVSTELDNPKKTFENLEKLIMMQMILMK